MTYLVQLHIKRLVVVMVAMLVLLPGMAISTTNSDTTATPAKRVKQLSAADIERARNYFTDTEMLTQEGDPVKFYSDVLDGHVVVINVIFTNCEGACPLITQKLVQISHELGDLYGSKIRFVSISNDPERDTPEALKSFAQKQGANLDGWTFLTGSKPKIDNVIKKIGLYTPQFEQHKSVILLGNTRTGHWQKMQPNLPHQAMSIKLKELAGEV